MDFQRIKQLAVFSKPKNDKQAEAWMGCLGDKKQ